MKVLACGSPIFFTVACKKSLAAPQKTESALSLTNSYRVTAVKEEVLEQSVRVVGTLAAKDQAVLGAKVASRLASIEVDLGSRVKKGDRIGTLEKRDYELKVKQAEALLAQARAKVGLPLQGADDKFDIDDSSTVRQAKAVLNEAQKHRDRIKKLTEENILPIAELETVESSFQVAQTKYQDAVQEVNNRLAILSQRRAEYEIALQELNDTEIIATFEGAIQERKASPGEYLLVGSPIVTLVRMDPLRLKVEVPEREAWKVQQDQLVRVFVDGDTNSYSGNIIRLSPAIDEENRMLMVEADIANPGRLRPGSFVRAEIITKDKIPGLLIPRSAMISFAGLEKVFTYESGQAQEKRVVTGRVTKEWVEVTQGLKKGEKVLIEPGNLQTGDPVQVIQ